MCSRLYLSIDPKKIFLVPTLREKLFSAFLISVFSISKVSQDRLILKILKSSSNSSGFANGLLRTVDLDFGMNRSRLQHRIDLDFEKNRSLF